MDSKVRVVQQTSSKRPSNVAAYAACTWAFLFAIMSFYWALGGTIGSDTMGNEIKDLALARDPWFIAILWGTGALKGIGGLFALALVRKWGKLFPKWLLLTAVWGAGVLLTLYAGANLFVRGLMAVGLMSTPESMHSAAARWHLFLWGPWWLLGGILFIAAAWTFQRTEKRFL